MALSRRVFLASSIGLILLAGSVVGCATKEAEACPVVLDASTKDLSREIHEVSAARVEVWAAPGCVTSPSLPRWLENSSSQSDGAKAPESHVYHVTYTWTNDTDNTVEVDLDTTPFSPDLALNGDHSIVKELARPAIGLPKITVAPGETISPDVWLYPSDLAAPTVLNELYLNGPTGEEFGPFKLNVSK